MRTETPHSELAQFMCNEIIRPLLPVAFFCSIPELTSLFSTLLRIAFVLLKRATDKMLNLNNAPFPFMQLPPELRDMVYENLLEDPQYPPPQPCLQNRGTSWLSALGQMVPTDVEITRHKSNFLFLANKQIYAEYMDLMCKKTTFHMTIAPHNYTPPTTPEDEEKPIWQISPEILKKIKRCEINLVTTSTMLGVSDPRNMKPEEWVLARQMRRQLSEIDNVFEINLHVKAIGDPLWNPLWVWYHATEALRDMGSPADLNLTSTKTVVSNGKPLLGQEAQISAPVSTSRPAPGPQFHRITFSLDMWSPGENYLMRDPANDNQWAWWCLKGHCVGQVGAELTVRQFCSWLYDCPLCYSDEHEDE